MQTLCSYIDDRRTYALDGLIYLPEPCRTPIRIAADSHKSYIDAVASREYAL